jgi:cell division protein FtsA
MANSRPLLGIDIGSTKIATVVGELDSSRGLILKSLNVTPTEAITRGTIRDLNQAARDIDESYSGAMYSSGVSESNAFIGLTGRELRGQLCRSSIEIDNSSGEVLEEDVDQIIEHARPANLAHDEQIVHMMVREFSLDGIRVSRSPVGMIGRRLDVEAHAVIGAEMQIANIERALERVDLQVRSYVYSLIASGETVLTAEDKNAGCILIDFGGGSTNVGIFLGGSLSYSCCIPIGGQNYDHDLKHGLGVSFEEALRIKKSYGKAWLDPENEELDDFIDVKFYGRREYDKVKRRRIFEIMQPRTDELLEKIIDALNESGQIERVAGGVTIVGGASQLRQLRRYLQRYLQRQVRVGLPTGVGHLLDEYRSPAYAPTLGLLVYGAKYQDRERKGEDGFMGEVYTAFKDILKGMFKRKA